MSRNFYQKFRLFNKTIKLNKHTKFNAFFYFDFFSGFARKFDKIIEKENSLLEFL